MILQRQRILTTCCTTTSFTYLGTLLFAFTLFHAYVDFAQYFVVWNGNIPDETFWYLIRENGFMVVREHDHHLRPFPAAVLCAAAHPRQDPISKSCCRFACGRG